MARPTIGVITVWASDVNYTTGPVPLQGTATKIARGAGEYAEGFRGDEVPPAQEFNDLLFDLSTWGRWVSQGSDSADEDDHIIETDTDGQANIARLVIPSHSVSGDGITVTAGGSSGIAVNAFGKGIRQGVLGTGGGTNGIGVQGTGGATNGYGVRGNGTGTGVGVYGFGGATGGIGVVGVGRDVNSLQAIQGLAGDALSTIGVEGVAEAQSGSVGVRGEGGAHASSWAIYGEAVHDDAVAIRGALPATANAGAYAVQGTGNGAGNGILASVGGGDTGYPLVVSPDTSSPDKAHMWLNPADDDPATQQQGDVWYSDELSTGQLKVRHSGQAEELHSSRLGYVFAADNSPTPNGSTAGGPATMVEVQFTPKDTGASGKVLVTGTCIYWGSSDTAVARFELYDVTSSIIIPSSLTQIRAKDIDGAGTNRYETVVIRSIYTLPNANTRTLRMRCTAITATQNWDDAVISVEGMLGS